jgi:ATP-binding cassette subfamily B protein
MKKRTRNRNAIKYYWRHARAYPRLILGVILSVPLTVLINSYLPPLILASVLSRLSQHDFVPDNVWSSFGPELVFYSLLLLTGVFAWRLVDAFLWRLETNVQRDIAEEVFDHMLKESADFHANNFSGSLVSQNNKLLAGYVRAADTTIFQTYPLIAGLVFTTIILWPRAPIFVLMLIGFALLYLTIAFKVSKPIQKFSARHAAAESQQTGFLADAITNVMAIKSFARKNYEKKRFEKATSLTQSRLSEFAHMHRKQMNYLGVLGRSMNGVALATAAISVVIFDANIGTVFLIFSYTASLADQLFSFSNNSLRNYNRSFGEASDMVAILSQTPAILDPEKPEKVQIHNGAIAFDNVTFTHNGSDDSIFENLSLLIEPGQKIGLVGHSGSGKTTFTRLLLRLSDIDSGRILIDEQNIAHITQDDLHSNIAYVPQEPLLFHRTIAENIGYGKEEASQEIIELAAKRANAAEFIEVLPHGYETLVGERGVKLSGGQRQRVAIARAMLKDAPILLLDEATSALDSESEKLIQDALWKLMEGRTAIVIAHRLSTIQRMDRIIVLDNGKIAEEGSHKDLLEKNGTYAKLWNHQSGGFLEE